MIEPVVCPELNPPVKSFDALRHPIYFFKDPIFGHKIFDIDCDCKECLSDDLGLVKLSGPKTTKPRPPKRKSSQQLLRERYEAGDPFVGLLG